MTPEQYLARAKASVAAAKYAEATAYASIAAAEAAIVAMQASAPPALYPGEHAPPLIEWCGKCHAPGRRMRGSGHGEKPCATCSYDTQPEVRSCRYCQTYIKAEGMSRNVRNSTWVDSRENRWCPVAPDPSHPQPFTKEDDPTPSSLWGHFLQALYGNGTHSVRSLIADYGKGFYFPVTRHGEVPAPELLEQWLEARLDRQHIDAKEGLAYHLAKTTSPDGEALWSADRAAA